MHVVIDAMNVLGSRPDGWWRDRDGALRRLAAEVGAWAATVDTEVVLVADGRPVAGLASGRHGALEVRYARRSGRDAADDRIVELVEGLTSGSRSHTVDEPPLEVEPGPEVEVVTADRELRHRVRALGAHVIGPRTLFERLDCPSGRG